MRVEQTLHGFTGVPLSKSEAKYLELLLAATENY